MITNRSRPAKSKNALEISVGNLRELEWRLTVTGGDEEIGVINALIAMFHWSTVSGFLNDASYYEKCLTSFEFISCSAARFQYAVVWAVHECLRRPGKSLLTNESAVYRDYLHLILYLPALFNRIDGVGSSSSNEQNTIDGRKISNLQYQAVNVLYARISRLPAACQDYLVNWFRIKTSTVQFIWLLRNVNRHLTLRTQTIVDDKSLSSDYGIRGGAHFMSLLFRANNDKHHLPVSEFYNLLLDTRLSADDVSFWRNYPFLRSLASKIAHLEHACQRTMSMGASVIPPSRPHCQYFNISVRRDNIVAESIERLQAVIDKDWFHGDIMEFKLRLRVEFVGESGIDGGGLAREWLSLLTAKLFSPDYGMFSVDHGEDDCAAFPWFSITEDETDANDFYMVGLVIGLAVFNSIIVNVPLPIIAYKLLLGHPITWTDLQYIRPGLYRGLQQMLAHDPHDVEGFADIYCRDFVVEYQTILGQRGQRDLCKNGSNIPVTIANREKYVHLLAEWYLVGSVRRQLDSFCRGFLSLFHCNNTLQSFQPEELQALVCGDNVGQYDWDSLRAVTEYDGCNDTDLTIEYFWHVAKSFDASWQRRLLIFITGSDRIPATGIVNMPLKISLHPAQVQKRLPMAHTCFNQLVLIRYDCSGELRAALIRAIEESAGFGCV